jgi:hypothetical protein
VAKYPVLLTALAVAAAACDGRPPAGASFAPRSVPVEAPRSPELALPSPPPAALHAHLPVAPGSLIGDAVTEQDTPVGPTSERMSCGLHNPMPGGFAAGYAADTGLDIAGMKMPVFAIGSGQVVYAESGHSLWSGRGDTDLAILIALDDPIDFEGREITHVWYAHLLELAFEQPRQSPGKRRLVKAGEFLGINGRANGMWHLHLGLLLDGDTSQGWGTFLLEDDVRKVLCGVRAKQRFPQQPKKKR